MKTTAIVLAAGSGKRMGTDVKKQFLLLKDKPILYYSLKVFEESFIDEVILVLSAEDMDFVRDNIIKKYGFLKVKSIVEGGKERYNSVLNALNACKECDYVFIHDGARPFVDNDMLLRARDAVMQFDACVVGVKSKDTVKISDEEGFVSITPNRETVWNIQTPQVFRFDLIKEAYNDVISKEQEYKDKGINITDDAMVLETYNGHRVKLVEGSYENIKVTTPSDLAIGTLLLA